MIANKRILFFIALWLFYTITQMKSLSWFDSGELALVGSQLGIGHPPGQPLYTLLCYLCYFISDQYAILLMIQLSVFGSILSFLALIKISTLRIFPSSVSDHSKLLAMLVMALAYPIWDHSTRLELYLLSTCFFLWGFYFGQKSIESHQIPYLAGLIIGFTFCLNPLFAIALALSLMINGLMSGLGFRFSLKAISYSFLCALLGLTPYLYFLFTLKQDQQNLANPWIWGNFNDFGDYLVFLTGADYGNNGLNHFSALPSNLWTLIKYWMESKLLIIVVIGLLGSLLSKRLWQLQVIALISCGIFPLLYQRYDPEIPDFQGYLLINMMLLSLGIANAIQWLYSQQISMILQKSIVYLLVFISLFSGGIGMFDGVALKFNRSRDHLAQEINDAILNDLPQQAIVIVAADHVLFNLLYAQRVQKKRTDVKIIAMGYLNSSWFWRDLYQTHPELRPIDIKTYPTAVSRLYGLLQANPHPVYLESLELAYSLGINACLDGWLVQANCQVLPKSFDFQSWEKQDPRVLLDPTNRSILAWWGTHLSFALWQEKKASDAIALLEAFQFKPKTQAKYRDWAVSPRLWRNDHQPLIGEIEYLEVIEEVLKNPPRINP